MPDSMRSRLCSRLRLNANIRTAGDYAGAIGYDDTVGAGTVRSHPFFIFDRPIFDGLTLDLSLSDRLVLHVARAVAAKDDDVNDDDCARDNGAGGRCAFDDTTSPGRSLGRTEGGHDRPFGVGFAPPACGHALRLRCRQLHISCSSRGRH
jgi:hypothetical protein